MVVKTKKVELTVAFLKLFVAFLQPSRTSKIGLFMKIVNTIKPSAILTNGFILNV